MRMTHWFGALVMTTVVGCGAHYDGGGRREEVPTEPSSSGGSPNIGLGGGASTNGGTDTGGTDTGGTDTGGTDTGGTDMGGTDMGGTGGALFTAGTGGSL